MSPLLARICAQTPHSSAPHACLPPDTAHITGVRHDHSVSDSGQTTLAAASHCAAHSKRVPKHTPRSPAPLPATHPRSRI
eukprot:915579-Rhodomonas_salina.1